MHVYLARRLLLVIPTLIGVSVIVFMLVRMLPGDAVTMLLQDYAYATNADELRAKLGLDRPIYVQYGELICGIVRGALGTSLRSKTPVADELVNRMPVTAELGLLAMVIGLVIAIPIGVIAAIRQDTWSDYLGRSTAIGFLAIPSFWLGTLVVTLPSVWWGWTPPLRYTRLLDDPVKNLTMVILPAILLGLALPGALMRLTRA